MYKKFQPASTEPFILGDFQMNEFKVVLSQDSGFDGFEEFTDLPCLHLCVTAVNQSLTWDVWRGIGGSTGVLIDSVVLRRFGICEHFFGDTLSKDDLAYRIELNSRYAANLQTVHFHLEVAHKTLFGMEGHIRRCIGSLLRADIIARLATADSVERTLQSLNIPGGPDVLIPKDSTDERARVLGYGPA